MGRIDQLVQPLRSIASRVGDKLSTVMMTVVTNEPMTFLSVPIGVFILTLRFSARLHS